MPLSNRRRQREGQRAAVERDVFPSQDVLFHFGRHAGPVQVETPARHQQAEGCAEQAQQNAFREELRHQPSAAGSQRGAQGHFARPAGGAREFEVGHVGAGDEQHEEHRAEEHEDVLPSVRANQKLADRQGYKAAVLVGIRVLAGEARADGVDFGRGLRRRAARFQPTHRLQLPPGARVHLLGVQSQRHP
jgi:hypothetical protein